LSLYV